MPNHIGILMGLSLAKAALKNIRSGSSHFFCFVQAWAEYEMFIPYYIRAWKCVKKKAFFRLFSSLYSRRKS